MSLALTDVVIDFQRNDDKVVIKGRLSGPAGGATTADFTVRVVVTDNRTGERHDSGDVVPNTVR